MNEDRQFSASATLLGELHFSASAKAGIWQISGLLVVWTMSELLVVLRTFTRTQSWLSGKVRRWGKGRKQPD
jgi:hypothetical protein